MQISPLTTKTRTPVKSYLIPVSHSPSNPKLILKEFRLHQQFSFRHPPFFCPLKIIGFKIMKPRSTQTVLNLKSAVKIHKSVNHRVVVTVVNNVIISLLIKFWRLLKKMSVNTLSMTVELILNEKLLRFCMIIITMLKNQKMMVKCWVVLNYWSLMKRLVLTTRRWHKYLWLKSWS